MVILILALSHLSFALKDDPANPKKEAKDRWRVSSEGFFVLT